MEATIVEVGRMLEATGLGIVRIANQVNDGGVFFAGENPARIAEIPHPPTNNGLQPSP